MDTSRINELKNRANTVKNASQEGENSATRVGQLIYDIIDYDGEQSNAITTLEGKANTMQEQINDIIEGGGGGGGGTAGKQKVFFTNITHDVVPDLPAVSEYVPSNNTFVHGSQVWTETNTNPGENQDTYMMWSWFVGTEPQSTSGPVRIYNGGQGGTGSNGEDANEIEWIYRRVQIKPTAEVLNTWAEALENAKGSATDKSGKPYTEEDAVPLNWEDHPTGIDENNKYEYASYRTSTIDENTGKRVWGTTGFSAPILWSAYGERGTDGDGVEYIFYADKDGRLNPDPVNYPPGWNENTQGKDGKTFQDNEFIALGSSWVDEPVDLGAAGYGQGSVQWVSMRKKQNSVWQAYSEPAVWSRLGKDGVVDGYTVDLSNENMPVGTSSDGTVSDWSNSSLVQVFHNSTPMTYDGNAGETPAAGYFNYTIGTITRSDGRSATGFSASKSNDTVIVSISTITNFNEVSATVPITIYLPGNITRYLVITVFGLATGEVGQFIDMAVGSKVIRSNYEGTTVTPSSMKVGVTIGDKTYWSTYGSPEGSAESMGYYFAYGYDGAIPAVHAGDISLSTGHSSLTVNMYKTGSGYEGMIIDSETIPIIKDGRPGDTGPVGPEGPAARGFSTITYYYKASSTKVAPTITTSDATDPANTNWSEDYPFLYCREWITYTNGDESWQGGSYLDKVWSDSGPAGPQGPVGPQGPQGPQGEQGEQGVQGAAAVMYDLLPSPSTVKFYVDKSTNTLTPELIQVSCKGVQITGETREEFTQTSPNGKYQIWYEILDSDGDYSDLERYTGGGISVSATSGVPIVAINFYLSQGEPYSSYIVKKITVPVDRDGLKGDRGEDATGQLGKFYFYAGEWEAMKAEGGWEIEATETEAPYFYVASENKYYMHTGEVPYTIDDTDIDPNKNPARWTEIQYNKFTMADAMFANYAHLGSMIINRDWVISQYGSYNGAQSGYKGYLSFDPIAFMTKIKGEASIGVITQGGTSASPKPNSQLFKVQRACTIYVKGSGSTTLVKLKSPYSNYFRFDNSPELPIDMYDPYTGVTRDVNNSSYTSFTVSSQNLGTYCFLNGNLSDIKVVCDNTNDVWIPNYALDLRAGFTYQNNAYVSGTVTATSGTIGGMTIDGDKITGTKNNSNVIIEPGTIQIANPVNTQQVITLNAATSEFYNSNIDVFGDVFVGKKLTAGGLKLGTSYISDGPLQTANARLNSNDGNVVFCIGCTSVTTLDGDPIFGPDNEEHTSPWNGIDRINCIFVYGFNYVGNKYGWNMFYCG